MNYYEILTVKKDASSKEIRQSYKTLMKNAHKFRFAKQISQEKLT